jgi:hypothetical protein
MANNVSIWLFHRHGDRGSGALAIGRFGQQLTEIDAGRQASALSIAPVP